MTLVKDANTNELNEITSSYIEEFQDMETRHIYVSEFLNTKIATQIKVLREQKGWTQEELAEKTGMRQERVSLLEDVNYNAWTVNVLRRFAEVFDLRLNVSFEEFGSFINEFVGFNRATLERKSFEEDEAFKSKRSKNSNQKPNKTLAKAKRQTSLGYTNTSNTNYPFELVKSTKSRVVTNTTPELPFQNLELAWSKPNNTSLENKSSFTSIEEDEDISTTQANYYVAVGKR